MMKVVFLSVVCAAMDVKWATFDGAEETTATWKVKNDPVMGGGSTSNFSTTAAGTGLFQGECRNVTFLNAPGFASVEGKRAFADVSGFDNIQLKVRSSTPAYQGFKLSFTAPEVPMMSGPTYGPKGDGSYKAGFQLTGGDWQSITIPREDFSYDWSPFTGRCDTKDPSTEATQHYCCSDSSQQPSKDEVCVDEQFLGSVYQVSIWAEGIEGSFELEVESLAVH